MHRADAVLSFNSKAEVLSFKKKIAKEKSSLRHEEVDITQGSRENLTSQARKIERS